jgi:hypothetical protein
MRNHGGELDRFDSPKTQMIEKSLLETMMTRPVVYHE